MSRRPQASRSRPNGSTGGNNAKSKGARIARCKRYALSAYPISTVKKDPKRQGFGHKGRVS